MRCAVITGVTGFIGGNLCEELLKNGTRVYGIGRNTDKMKKFECYPNFRPLVSDFENYVDLGKNISEEPDVFFHTAYQGVAGKAKREYRTQMANIKATCDSMELACKLKSARYVYCGSVDEYETSLNPDKLTNRLSHSALYGSVKLLCEVFLRKIAEDNNIVYCSILLPLVYGEGNKQNILPNVLLKNISNNSDMDLIDSEQFYDMIYIKSAIKQLINVAQFGQDGESYYGGHVELFRFHEFIDSICDILGARISLNYGKYSNEPLVKYDKINRRKLSELTGDILSNNLCEGIISTQKWLKSVGYLDKG